MFDVVRDFIVEYYFTGGYNAVNTVTYGILLGVIVFRIIPWLKPFIGRIDRGFVLMVLPYILYGSTMREMVDQELGVYAGHTVYPANWFFVAPGIYFTMFFLTLVSILVALIVQRMFGVNHRLVAGLFGSLLFLYNMSLIIPKIKHLDAFVAVCAFFALSTAFVYALKVLFGLRLLDFEANVAVVLVHMFDASTTFVGVDIFGHYEKHVVPTFFINLLQTAAVMYPLKLLVLLPALYVIDDEMRDDEFSRRFVKFVIVVLGAGPALRNSVLLLLG